MADAQHDITTLMPADTPRYMIDAWLRCIWFAFNRPERVKAFHEDTGNRWAPARSPIERMSDEVTDAEWAFVKAFVEWANVNVWGPIEEDANR